MPRDHTRACGTGSPCGRPSRRRRRSASAWRPCAPDPRATARRITPQASSQLMRAMRHAPVTVLHWRIRSITRRSSSSVNRLRASAHGTPTCRTPCVGQCTRGTRACRNIWYWHVSRWRQTRSSAWSWPGRPCWHSGQAQDVSASCSTQRSTRSPDVSNATRAMCHGACNPTIALEERGVLHPAVLRHRRSRRTAGEQAAHSPSGPRSRPELPTPFPEGP